MQFKAHLCRLEMGDITDVEHMEKFGWPKADDCARPLTKVQEARNRVIVEIPGLRIPKALTDTPRILFLAILIFIFSSAIQQHSVQGSGISLFYSSLKKESYIF